MSPNTPPPNVPPASGQPPGQGNPYFGAADHGDASELDAEAPSLRNEEGQRLNRRALLFLAATVLLIIVMGILFMTSFKSGDDKKAIDDPRLQQRVRVPDAPAVADAPPLPDAAPIPTAQQSEPPPLPVAEPREYGLDRGGRSNERRGQEGPSLVDRRIADTGGTDGASDGAAPGMGLPQGNNGPVAASDPGTQPPIQAQLAKVAAAGYLHKPDALLIRGTYIRCVLETHIVTDLSGFTSCIVTEPVYSVNGRNLLLPKGSKIVGSYSGGGGRTNRVAVVWDRITTPNGLDITMASPGVDNLGGAGHPGDLDNHWASRISSSLMISLIADAFKYVGEKNGPQSTTMSENGTVYTQPYESQTAQTAQRLADQMLQQQMGRSPTITINQGTVLNVYVAMDVDFTDVLKAAH